MTLNSKHSRLTHLSLIKISGDDAAVFLQGQLTNDIEKLDQNWQFSGYCNPKGRLLALLQIWRTPAAIYALTHSSVLESITKRLRMYVLRSKVVIEPVETAKIVGLEKSSSLLELAPVLAAKLKQNGVTMAASDSDTAPLFALTIDGKKHSQNPRALLIDLSANETSEIWKNQGLEDAYLSSEQWSAYDINDGLAQITAQSSELFIPQMLNLDVLDGISFKKGCYTGQEIVARMHYLGKLKQRLFVCKLSALGRSHEPGDKVHADQELTKSVGHLVLSTDNSDLVLAVLRLDSVAIDCTLYLDSQTSLTPVSEQPYTLPS